MVFGYGSEKKVLKRPISKKNNMRTETVVPIGLYFSSQFAHANQPLDPMAPRGKVLGQKALMNRCVRMESSGVVSLFGLLVVFHQNRL